MRTKFSYCFFIAFMTIIFPTADCIAQNLFINEFMALNSSTIADPDFNGYSDWLEIFNADSIPVNLKDYFITDDPADLQKFKILPDLIIPAGGYQLIWADNMNTGIHTNFNLSASGEFIGLYRPDSVIADTVTFGIQEVDISEGRFPNGTANLYKFSPASPGTANLPENIYNKLTQPVFSLSGGFYQSPVTIALSHPDPGAAIYYTIDGKTPTQNSYLYSNPVTIDSTTAVTATAFKDNFVNSSPVINTYFINFNTDLPVFSLVTDPDNFFSDTSGIYVIGTNGIPGNCSTNPRNWNQNWERPVNLQFYESDKSIAFNLNAGVKIYGGCSRIYAMKSLGLYFREMYGADRLNYRLFREAPILSFNNIILRSSGQDWWRTMFRDPMVQYLIKRGMNIDFQEYRPSLVFLNGAYWGIHNVREKLDDSYLNTHYGVDVNNIDLVEISKGVSASNGDLEAYNSMINFLSLNDMSLPENYEYIKSIADMDNYIDFQIAEIYSANADWPGSNVKLWKTRVPSGKWRWMIYDLDFTFGGNAKGQYYSNTLELATEPNGPSWPNPPWATIMFRRLLLNAEFRNEFIQRFAAHMNTTFNPAYVNSIIDSMGAVIADEIPRHKARWPQAISIGPDWLVNVQIMRDFAYLRQPEVRNHFYSKFNLTGSYTLRISRNNTSWGKVFTHNIEVKNNDSLNTFFQNIPLKVKALAMPGYRFVRWEGISNSTLPEIVITTSGSSYLEAVFEKEELSVTTLVINEINYKSSPSFDTEDWIELYNPVDSAIDISGWQIMDDNITNAYTFPPGTIIQGNGYVVLSRDTAAFNSHHLNITGVYGNLDFGLSSSGDMILLFNSTGILIDSVQYGVSGEWTSLPNGNGPTLSLINPQFDNTQAANWRASNPYGTPGRINDTYTKVQDENNPAVTDFHLYNNYPNPFNPSTRIKYSVPDLSLVQLKVYDVIGREIAVLVNSTKPGGVYEVEFKAESGLPSGVYFYTLSVSGSKENRINTRKMILLK